MTSLLKELQHRPRFVRSFFGTLALHRFALSGLIGLDSMPFCVRLCLKGVSAFEFCAAPQFALTQIHPPQYSREHRSHQEHNR